MTLSKRNNKTYIQQFNPGKFNQLWSTDITYLLIRQGRVYTAIVIDLHSRKIVCWSIA